MLGDVHAAAKVQGVIDKLGDLIGVVDDTNAILEYQQGDAAAADTALLNVVARDTARSNSQQGHHPSPPRSSPSARPSSAASSSPTGARRHRRQGFQHQRGGLLQRRHLGQRDPVQRTVSVKVAAAGPPPGAASVRPRMTRVLTIAGTDLSDRGSLYSIRAEGRASFGELGLGAVTVYDDLSDLFGAGPNDPFIWKQWSLTEDASGYAVVLEQGRIANFATGRGDDGSKVAAQIRWFFDLEDANRELVGFDVMDEERPEETDVERVAYFADTYLTGRGASLHRPRRDDLRHQLRHGHHAGRDYTETDVIDIINESPRRRTSSSGSARTTSCTTTSTSMPATWRTSRSATGSTGPGRTA